MSNKKCCICKKDLDLKLFSKCKSNKDGLQTKCKECHKIYVHGHYLKNKQVYKNKNKKQIESLKKKFIQYKSILHCKYCHKMGVRCIEFHHTNKNIKDDTVSNILRYSRSWNKILEEIKKCEVVCSNCHRKIHANKIYKKHNSDGSVRVWCEQYKQTLCCTKCGEKSACCLDFHHNKDKKFAISRFIRQKGCNLADLIEEIKKCTVMCVNCHREEHI